MELDRRRGGTFLGGSRRAQRARARSELGALTQIFHEYSPPDVPVIVEQVVSDIDTIVRQVSSTGCQTSQPGDRQVRVELRKALSKHGLPTTGDLFDRAYAYIRENY